MVAQVVVGVYPCAKIRIFKQITTLEECGIDDLKVFILVQRYEFLSKSQLLITNITLQEGVYPCAKIRIFKQITTAKSSNPYGMWCLSLCKDTNF